MYYEEKFCFTNDSFDNKGNIFPFFILKIFEKAACIHGEKLGVSFSDLIKKNLLWIVSQIKYQVIKSILPNEELTIKTWPLEPKRLGYTREYLVTNQTGEIVIKGSSNWLTIDSEDRKLRIKENVFPKMEYMTCENFGGKIPRLRETGEFIKVNDIVPDKTHIDSNGHVNNKHYTTFISDAIKEFDGVIGTFQIDYIKEIMPEDKVSVYVLKNENETMIKGGEDNNKNFVAKIEYK